MINAITKSHIIRLILFGSCKIPNEGDLISNYSQSDLIWADKILTKKERRNFGRPLWTYSGFGYGSGGYCYDGYGSGYYGYGSGGDGYCGYGSGDYGSGDYDYGYYGSGFGSDGYSGCGKYKSKLNQLIDG